MSSQKLLRYEATIFVRDSCLCLHVQRAARSLGRRFDEVLRPFGLTHGQFSLLMSLNRPEPPTMAPVANLLAMDRTTLTAALKPLERRGLVRGDPHPTDKRSRVLILTDLGRKVLALALPAWKATNEELEKALRGTDLDQLRKNLKSLS